MFGRSRLVSLVVLLLGCGPAVVDGQGETSSATSEAAVTASSTSDSIPPGEAASGSSSPVPPQVTTTGGSSESSSSEDSGSSSTGGPILDVCRTLPETAEVSVLGTVEGWLYDRDFAMTGSGTFITQDGRSLVEVDGMGQTTPWLALPDQLYDFTFLRPVGDGTLLGSSGQYEDLLRVSPSGIEPVDVDFEPWWAIGVSVRANGGAWITDWPRDRILSYAPKTGVEVVLQLPKGSSPFELFEDIERQRLYWTAAAGLWSAPMQEGGLGKPVLVHDPSDASLPGLARDVCGNFYVLGRAAESMLGNSLRLVRLEVDEAGTTVEREVELVEYKELGNQHSRLRFGFGFGSSLDQSLFTEGDQSSIVVIDVGIEGAPDSSAGE